LAGPTVSVLIPAYNAEPYIREALQSVLSQSLADFEVVVVDDASSDATVSTVSSVGDDRVRLVCNPRNLGAVSTMNRGLAECRGRLIARLDADDYCLPGRFERQVRFLRENPDTLMVGSAGLDLVGETLSRPNVEPEPDPVVLRWLFHIVNPIGHSSMMFRRDAVDRLGEYLREDFTYAADFDFSHRLLALGPVAMVPEHLVVYRRVEQSMSRSGSDRVVRHVSAVLQQLYRGQLGTEADAAAQAVASHIMGGQPIRSDRQFAFLGAAVDRLAQTFMQEHRVTDRQRARIVARTAELWWRVVTGSLRAGALQAAVQGFRCFRYHRQSIPPATRLARAALRGLASNIGLVA
jgi:GT2 family glycosyltransferase